MTRLPTIPILRLPGEPASVVAVGSGYAPFIARLARSLSASPSLPL